MTIALTVQPRVQREKWSLYWKESMMTKTDILDPVVLNVDEKKTKVTADRRLSFAARLLFELSSSFRVQRLEKKVKEEKADLHSA